MFERPKGDLFLTAEERRTKLLSLVEQHNSEARDRDCYTCDYYKAVGAIRECSECPDRNINVYQRRDCNEWTDDGWQDYMYKILLEIEEGHAHEQI